MLDWMFMLFFLIAIIFIIMSLITDEREAFWKLLFITVSIGIWFILALSNLNIETAYSIYNSTTGNTTLGFAPYIDEGSIYLSYFFGLMGCLCMIYLVVLIFDTYYAYMDKKENE